MLQPSTCEYASVHGQRCANDVRSLIRTDEGDGICNFFGSADALIRNLTLEEGCFVLGRLCETVEHSRFNRYLSTLLGGLAIQAKVYGDALLGPPVLELFDFYVTVRGVDGERRASAI